MLAASSCFFKFVTIHHSYRRCWCWCWRWLWRRGLFTPVLHSRWRTRRHTIFRGIHGPKGYRSHLKVLWILRSWYSFDEEWLQKPMWDTGRVMLSLKVWCHAGKLLQHIKRRSKPQHMLFSDDVSARLRKYEVLSHDLVAPRPYIGPGKNWDGRHGEGTRT